VTGTSTIMIVFSAALACALAGTPVVRRAAGRLGFFDRPAPRKLHQDPVPLLGGVAIYGAVVISVVVFGHHYLQELAGILVAASVMALLGLLDDGLHLRTSVKFGVQVAVAVGLHVSGVKVSLGGFPVGSTSCCRSSGS
jgi:UDP-GlcNAc:undecaprenyl-phosphate GlcNAc-1-phosphate transferase